MATKVNIPAAPGVSIPELGIEGQDLRKAGKALSRDLYKRLLGMIFNEMDAAGTRIVNEAKDDLSAFDNPDSTKGLLAQGLYHWDQPKVKKSGLISMGFGWTRAYGRVLEFGPSVTEWMIYPKFKKALRWTATNFMGPTRSGIPGEKTMFSKSVKHKWKKDQLRPHLVPAVERGIPKLEKRLIKGIEREFARTRI